MKFSALAAFAALALAAQPAGAAARTITLHLPHALAAHQALVAIVRLGAVPRGTTIRVRTADGTLLGTLSPYAIVPGQEAGSYTVPIPADAVKHGEVTLLVGVEISPTLLRAPRTDEVESVSLRYIGVSP
ncbi:MAG TPA: hypothetical protein VHU87_12860 [Rhizomicrobium sp.]|nr:hypothetical protein [Rhizomicrobium sp.]